MRIAILGCGYVGLVSGACLAEIGHSVVCTDNDESKIVTLNQGGLPIYEPHLDEIVARNVEAGRLRFTADWARRCATAMQFSSAWARRRCNRETRTSRLHR